MATRASGMATRAPGTPVRAPKAAARSSAAATVRRLAPESTTYRLLRPGRSRMSSSPAGLADAEAGPGGEGLLAGEGKVLVGIVGQGQ
jgi:hypothetical protein